MYKAGELAQKLIGLIAEGKLAEALEVHKQLGAVLETYIDAC